MSLKEQVRQHFRQADVFFDQAWRYHAHLGHMHADSEARLRTLQQYGEELLATHPALTGPTRQELHRLFQTRIATSRIQVRNSREQMDNFARHLRELQEVCGQSRGLILGAMDCVIDSIWDLFGAYHVLPSFVEMLAGAEMLALEALLPVLPGVEHVLADLSPDKLLQDAGNMWNQWTSWHTGGVGSAPGGGGATVAQACAAVTPTSNQLANHAAQCQAIQGKLQKEYSGCLCCRQEHDYTVPDYPTVPTTHSKADLTSRAQHIHALLQQGEFGMHQPDTAPNQPAESYSLKAIAPYLRDLSAADVQALESIYDSTYNTDLIYDLQQALQDPYDRYSVFQMLTPDSITTQTYPTDMRGQSPLITMKPPLSVVDTGTTVTFSMDPGAAAYAAGAQHISYCVIPDPAVVAKLRAEGKQYPFVMQGTGAQAQMRLPESGSYTVVFEVQYADRPPRYYTYTQTVVSESDFALQSLLTRPGPPLQPELIELLVSLQIKQLESQGKHADAQKLQTQLDYIESQLKDDIAPAIPIQALLVPTGTSQPIPLQLYAKPLPGGKWQIVDLTDPNPDDPENKQSYTGNSIQDAWNNFVAHNHLPGGQLAAQAPMPPPGYPVTVQVPQGTWIVQNNAGSTLEAWRDRLGSVSLWTTLAGLGLLLVPGAEEVGAGLLWVSLFSGAAAGGLDIASQVTYGTFRWNDPQTLLDILSIAALLSAGTLSAFENLPRAGQAVLIVADQGNRYGSALLLADSYRQQIIHILQTEKDPQKRKEEINAVLLSAAQSGGLILLGVGVGHIRGVPALDGTWQGATDVILPQLKDHLDPGLYDAFSANPNDPRMREALITYFGNLPKGSAPDILALSKLDPKTLQAMESDFNVLWEQCPPGERGRFADWLFTVDSSGFSQFERYRLQKALVQLNNEPLPTSARKGYVWTPDDWNTFKLLFTDPSTYTLGTLPKPGGWSDADWEAFKEELSNPETYPRMKTALINVGYDYSALEHNWENWQAQKHAQNLTSSTGDSFISYLSHIGVANALDIPDTRTVQDALAIVNEGKLPGDQGYVSFNDPKLSLRDKQYYLYIADNPKFAAEFASLPPNAQEAINDILTNTNMIGDVDSSASLKTVREKLVHDFNALLGARLAKMVYDGRLNYDDVLQVLSYTDVLQVETALGPSGGSVAAWYSMELSQLYKPVENKSDLIREPEFKRGMFDPSGDQSTAGNSLRPDGLRKTAGRLYESKFGYQNKLPETAQLDDYHNLIAASKKAFPEGGSLPTDPNILALRKLLQSQYGITEPLKGVDYLFQSPSAYQTAKDWYSTVQNRGYGEEVDVYFIGEDGNTYKYLGQGRNPGSLPYPDCELAPKTFP